MYRVWQIMVYSTNNFPSESVLFLLFSIPKSISRGHCFGKQAPPLKFNSHWSRGSQSSLDLQYLRHCGISRPSFPSLNLHSFERNRNHLGVQLDIKSHILNMMVLQKYLIATFQFWDTYRHQLVWNVLANYSRRSVFVNIIAIRNVFVTGDKISFFAFECCLLSNTTKVFTNQVSTPWCTVVFAPVRNAHSWKDNWDYRNVIFIFLNGCILDMGIHIVSLYYLVGSSRYNCHLL